MRSSRHYPREGAMVLYRSLVKESDNEKTYPHHRRLKEITRYGERERAHVLDILSLLPSRPNIGNRNGKASSQHLGLYARKRKKKVALSSLSQKDDTKKKNSLTLPSRQSVPTNKPKAMRETKKEKRRSGRTTSCSPYQRLSDPKKDKFRISKSGVRPSSLQNGDYVWHPVRISRNRNATGEPVSDRQTGTVAVVHDVMKYYHGQYHKTNISHQQTKQKRIQTKNKKTKNKIRQRRSPKSR